jgi:hypothetical protein
LVEAVMREDGDGRALQLGDFGGVRHFGDFVLEQVIMVFGEFGDAALLLRHPPALRPEHFTCHFADLLRQSIRKVSPQF